MNEKESTQYQSWLGFQIIDKNLIILQDKQIVYSCRQTQE